MRKIYLTWSVLAGLFVVAMGQNAQAQRPAHFYPARPTFSTYLLYRQLNTTGIPNYYSYVQPATQYRDFVTRNPGAIGSYDGRQSLVSEQDVARILDNQLRQRETTGIGQVAVPAVFGDTGHFYPQAVPARRR